MRYGALAGGKRLRPFLVLESAALFGVPRSQALMAGAALECIHCYSLVHDDLPAMDNDDLRRGRPTTHKAFDDATAILAGDALLTIAFDILSREETHPDPAVRIALVQKLARASGLGGMVGGQLLDLAAEGRFGTSPIQDERSIVHMQSMKTGALLHYACIAGGILGNASKADRDRAVALRTCHRCRLPGLPTTCSMSKATRRHSARRPARMQPPARRRWSASSAFRPRASASPAACGMRKPPWPALAIAPTILRETARFIAARNK